MKSRAVILLAAAACIALLPHVWIIIIGGPAIAALLLLDHSLLRVVRQKTFVITALLLIVIQPFLSGGGNSTFDEFRFSTVSLFSGLAMTVRAVVLMMAFSHALKNISPSTFLATLEKRGLPDFGKTLSDAQDALPHVRVALLEQVSDLRTSRGRRKVLASPVEWTARILAKLLRHSQLAPELEQEHSAETVVGQKP